MYLCMDTSALGNMVSISFPTCNLAPRVSRFRIAQFGSLLSLIFLSLPYLSIFEEKPSPMGRKGKRARRKRATGRRRQDICIDLLSVTQSRDSSQTRDQEELVKPDAVDTRSRCEELVYAGLPRFPHRDDGPRTPVQGHSMSLQSLIPRPVELSAASPRSYKSGSSSLREQGLHSEASSSSTPFCPEAYVQRSEAGSSAQAGTQQSPTSRNTTIHPRKHSHRPVPPTISDDVAYHSNNILPDATAVNEQQADSGHGTSSAVDILGQRGYALVRPRFFKSRRVRAEDIERPWLDKKDPRDKWLVILPCLGVLFGLCASALLVWDGLRTVINHSYCLILDEDFSNGLDPRIWTKEAEVGGFG